jgi:hypothetical protein
MKDKIFYSISLLVISTIISIFFTSNTFAAVVPPKSMGFYDIKPFTDNQKLDLPKNEISYYFNLSDGINLNDDCYINLHFTFSNTLIEERSNITLLINDYPIETKWIYDLAETSSGWWKLPIPVSKLDLLDLNKLTIQSNQRSIEGDCADYDNPSNWILIHNDSVLHLSLNTLPHSNISNFYPVYFDSPWSNDSLSCDFILPENFDENLLSHLFKLSSAIGKNYPYKKLVNYSTSLNTNSQNSDKNKIYIGLSSQLEENFLLKFFENDLMDDEGILSSIEPTDTSPYYSTLISASNEIGLNKAVNFLSNKTISSQINESSVIVKSDPPLDKKNTIPEKNIYDFSDFGYEDTTLAGAFHQQLNLSFTQPNGIKNIEGSYINIKFNHSKVLESDKSIITAYINNVAINSAKLSNGNAEEGELKVLIPVEALDNPTIDLKIDCYNYIGKIDCSKDYYESAWTVIKSDSEISFIEGENILQPKLRPFPFFYNNNEYPLDVLVGLSNNSDLDLLEAMEQISTRAGQNTGETLSWPILKDISNLSKDEKNMNMIFLGYTKDLNLPNEIQEQLLIKPLNDGNFIINEDLQVTPETMKDKLIFQVIRSPWDSSKRIYIILCQNEDNLVLLKNILGDSDLLYEIDGQASLVDKTEEVYNITVKEKELVVAKKTLSDKLTFLESKTNMPWWLLLIIVLLIFTGIFFISRLRKEKNQFHKVGEALKTEQGFTDTEQKKDQDKM